jgi:para-nitrobenzyl esterase
MVTAVLATSVLPGTASAATGPPIVSTDSGLIQGADGPGYRQFNAVPYAAPPTGDRRWRPPQPMTAWRGTRDATTTREECAQNSIFKTPEGVEDCLYLNVTAPTTPGRHPVLVFLHGGSFQNGSGAQYNAVRLATRGGLVVVTINYRLGVFGYLALPGLPGAGTFGLQDQQAALRWVHRNAAAFGGDPDNITLDGQSAGAESVCAQLTSPSGSRLFDKAIMQSGSCLTNWPTNMFLPGIPAGSQFSPLPVVERTGSNLATTFDCPAGGQLACLRSQDAFVLLDKTKQGTGVAAFLTPAYGTPLMPESPADALRDGKARPMPVLDGNNLDEQRGILGAAELFIPPFTPYTADDYHTMLRTAFGNQAGRVATHYPVDAYAAPDLAWAAAATDRIWACPTLTTQRLLARLSPTYAYEFAEQNGPQQIPDVFWGATHGAELPYLFDVTYPETGAIQPGLADRMIDAWARFAATGRAPWPAVAPHAAQPYDQVFAAGRGGSADLSAEHQCNFWATITG